MTCVFLYLCNAEFIWVMLAYYSGSLSLKSTRDRSLLNFLLLGWVHTLPVSGIQTAGDLEECVTALNYISLAYKL